MFNKFAKSLKDSLERTRQSVFGQIMTAVGQSDLTEETFDELEALLIQADVGMVLADEITATLESKADTEGIIRSEIVRQELRRILRQHLQDNPPFKLNGSPTVLLMVGVNGSGKTTTTAKLARYFQNQKKTVMLAAGDTFRAAAVEQLQIWGQRLNVPVIAGQPNADPGSVAHDAVNAAKARGIEILIVDTAGRLQNKFNLMEELRKVRGVIAKAAPGAPHETLLVLDATTGQNALTQAQAFKEAVALSGVVLAKLDGSAKGGMAFAIQHDLGIPIRLVGTGEKVDDLAWFEADKFVDGLLEA